MPPSRKKATVPNAPLLILDRLPTADASVADLRNSAAARPNGRSVPVLAVAAIAHATVPGRLRARVDAAGRACLAAHSLRCLGRHPEAPLLAQREQAGVRGM